MDRSLLPTTARLEYNGDNVYFVELMQSQLKPDGKGLGVFAEPTSDVDKLDAPSMEGLSEGSLLQYVDGG